MLVILSIYFLRLLLTELVICCTGICMWCTTDRQTDMQGRFLMLNSGHFLADKFRSVIDGHENVSVFESIADECLCWLLTFV